MSGAAASVSKALAGLLVGLGVAVLARTVHDFGFDEGLKLGFVLGPGLIVAGLIRLRLQRMLETPPVDKDPDARPEGGANRGDPS